MESPAPATREAAPPARCQLAYDLRAYVPSQGDEGLVYLSYLRSYWRWGVKVNWNAERRREPNWVHGAAGSAIRREVYQAGQRGIIDSILEHAEVRIACNPADRWQALGFAIFDDLDSGLVLHYVYVKRVFRHAGLATAIVMDLLGPRRSLVHTHVTELWIKHLLRGLKRRGVDCLYDPYLAR